MVTTKERNTHEAIRWLVSKQHKYSMCLFFVVCGENGWGYCLSAFFLVLLAAFLALGTTLAPFFSRAANTAFASEGDILVIAIDLGHGGGEAGAYGYGVAEEDANLRISRACVEELQTYTGVKVVLTHDDTRVIDRQGRIDAAVSKNADVVISMHCNAAGASSAHGCEAWVPNSSSYYYNECHVAGYNLADAILNKISALGISKRGVFTRDCDDGECYIVNGNNYGLCDYYGINYWARWYGIPGIIIEHAFVSNPSEAALLGDSGWCRQLGIADATGIAEYYGLKKYVSPDQTGEDTTVVTDVPEGDPSIMGTPCVTVSDMVALFNGTGNTFPSGVYQKYGAANIEQFCNIMFEEAVAEGVRPEVAFAQSMLETGWLKFGGIVQAEWCNFAGIGAVDGGSTAAIFNAYGSNSVRMGIRAQIQHLKAYGCAEPEPLAYEKVDPRFDLVSPKGKAPTVNGLSGTWASDTAYGSKLIALIQKMTGSSSGPVAVNLSMSGTDGLTSQIVYVDGVAQTLGTNGEYGTVQIGGSGAHVITAFVDNATSDDPHKVYPVRMIVWTATISGATCTTQRAVQLDNLLQYGGSSIRVAGKYGIRLITGMNKSTKNSLIANGYNGFKLVQTGTLLAWSSKVENGGLTMDTPGVSRGIAYDAASGSNPVFSSLGNVEQYTNVLVGFSTDQCKGDLSMRSYAILQDGSGHQLVIYGGCVQRSIGYIASQNANAFPVGSDAYNFVHGIIDACG